LWITGKKVVENSLGFEIKLELPKLRFVFYVVNKLETQTSGDSSDATIQHRV
jgi:hypothetical protein